MRKNIFLSVLLLGFSGTVNAGFIQGDFDGDGAADILWRNTATGQNYLYLMTENTIKSSLPINTVADLNWKIVGTRDMCGDGQVDILWHNSATGQVWLYQMNGAVITQSSSITTVSDLNWKIVSTDDFNGDFGADILWRNSATGQVWYYQMNCTEIVASSPVATVANMDWKIVGAGSFSPKDFTADILWHNSVTGQVWLYQMNGPLIVNSGPVITVADLNWQIVGNGAFGDFVTGNGKSILWRNSTTGQNWLYEMSGTTIMSSGPINTVADPNWKVFGTNDYSGDFGFVSDILWRNTATGQVWLYLMDNNMISESVPVNTVSDPNWQIINTK